MMKIKNKLHLLPFFLMSYLAFFFLININPVIAMDNNNKDKQIKNYEVSDKEINDFFELSTKRLKKNISDIKAKKPLLQNASIKEIEEWVFKIISFYLFIFLGLSLFSDSLLETENNINRKFYKQLIYISKCVFYELFSILFLNQY